jgi:hypothetical protein
MSSTEPTMRRSTSFVVRARSIRSSRTSPPFSVAASPSTATTPDRHAASPPNGLSAASTSSSSDFVTSPR